MRKEEPDVNTNVNLEAAAGVLALAGGCLVLLLLGLLAAHALVKRRPARARKVALVALAGGAVYLGGVLAFSAASAERVLAGGEEKYFCEIDCHLAYAVVGVRKAKTLGRAPGEATAAGEFYVVHVRTRFDENTVSPRRDDRPLTPNARAATVFDSEGRSYSPSPEGLRALELSGEAGPPLSTPLRPGESYTTALVFDLPPGVREPVLLLNESSLPTRFIIGHENSLLHKRTKFRIEPRAESAARPAE